MNFLYISTNAISNLTPIQMAKYAGKYRIESNRWQYWDYSAPANYFITVFVNRQCVLGTIDGGSMHLSALGKIVAEEIQQIPTYHHRVVLDEWVVMPNHIHLIITLEDFDERVETIHELSLQEYQKLRRQMLIPKIMGKLKMQTSKQINFQRNTPNTKNWQPNFHDHVIRNEKSYYRIKKYIINNPKNWGDDTFYNDPL